jgi:transcriptional regulator with XRE-family HTH domain
MEYIKNIRNLKGISQRNLAVLAGISYKTLQLLEEGGQDPKLSTLQRIASALGYPPNAISLQIQRLLALDPDAVAVVSERIVAEGRDSWKIWLFNFVDAFRVCSLERIPALIAKPPVDCTPPEVQALLASTVEALCAERKISVPPWCMAIDGLKEPWFVSGMENLKALSLVESPVHFRKRNIFVLGNFLERR